MHIYNENIIGNLDSVQWHLSTSSASRLQYGICIKCPTGRYQGYSDNTCQTCTLFQPRHSGFMGTTTSSTLSWLGNTQLFPYLSLGPNPGTSSTMALMGTKRMQQCKNVITSSRGICKRLMNMGPATDTQTPNKWTITNKWCQGAFAIPAVFHQQEVSIGFIMCKMNPDRSLVKISPWNHPFIQLASGLMAGDKRLWLSQLVWYMDSQKNCDRRWLFGSSCCMLIELAQSKLILYSIISSINLAGYGSSLSDSITLLLQKSKGENCL